MVVVPGSDGQQHSKRAQRTVAKLDHGKNWWCCCLLGGRVYVVSVGVLFPMHVRYVRRVRGVSDNATTRSRARARYTIIYHKYIILFVSIINVFHRVLYDGYIISSYARLSPINGNIIRVRRPRDLPVIVFRLPVCFICWVDGLASSAPCRYFSTTVAFYFGLNLCGV